MFPQRAVRIGPDAERPATCPHLAARAIAARTIRPAGWAAAPAVRRDLERLTGRGMYSGGPDLCVRRSRISQRKMHRRKIVADAGDVGWPCFLNT
jgi:hypothetical protein